jgi:hypothetical protein
MPIADSYRVTEGLQRVLRSASETYLMLFYSQKVRGSMSMYYPFTYF